MYWIIFCDIIKDKILFRRRTMEDPSSQNLFATICFIVYFDDIKCFFSATEMVHGFT